MKSSIALVLCPALLLTACGTNGTPPARTLSVADFVAPDRPAAAPGDRPADAAETPSAAAQPARRAPRAVTLTGPVSATDGILDVTTEPGTPDLTTAPPPPIAGASAAFVDAKIGDFNNKAIYASDFLEPMGDRLRAENRRLKPDAWQKFAREQIRRELDRRLEDELLRSEAISSLKPEQRQGLLSFLDSQFEDQRLRAGGQEAARRRLYEEKGLSEEEFLRRREDEELIRYEIGRKIANKVQVSRTDMEIAYDRNYEMFNPDPKAYFRQIILPAENTQAIDEIAAELRAGKPFAEVAARPDNEYAPSKGGQRDPIAIDGSLAATTVFGIEELNAAAQSLLEAQWTGPITYTTPRGRKLVSFLYLERLETISTSFYDAQLTLERGLRDMRTNRERQKYIEYLKDRASFTDLDEMTDRLLTIATERYGPGATAR